MLKLHYSSKLFKRYLSSALYLTGDKAREQFAVLVPYLDFKHKLGDFERLKRIVRLRAYPIDCDNLKLQWELYRDVEKRKQDIERCRTELQKRIQQSTDEEEKKALKARAVQARDDLKMLKERSYAVADSFIANNFLAIPNDLHERTPEVSGKVLHEKHAPPSSKSSGQHNLVEEQFEQFGPSCLYLTGDAAWMDLRLPMRCCETFQEQKYILFCNPDFVRTFLLEAAMVPKGSLYLVREDDEPEDKVNLLHLCGGGSLLGFLGYFTKLCVFPSVLPLRLVASGKRYHFEQTQSNEVHMFGACKTAQEAELLFDETVQHCRTFYDQLPVGYRIVQVTAPELQPAESMRVDVELYDDQERRYVKVAHVSYLSDFLSKRIAFIYQEGKAQKFPHIVTGQVLSSVDLIKLLLRNGIQVKDLPFLDTFGAK
ncbi:serine--tRNA synthetase-like protein Slimp [Anopheles ziemanni]|uniref:serine--tRNA synthetase-like protein Slimp n=1 Tax=Anopheles coustani TaxID=139045 RepID=UPI002658949B|nr:serine--tRNA synthetase-like protein Slimp [Anopheles coustani]XP_058175081.1 serine--tRNA synthetase-like protein Slimp [Anopheles ziemanni]